ncbi:hypothetical protein HY622_00440 [Candidatus Uhrbacteria bacterium]|nr:hypothetical protein [Candidatus Uhrbacteria bacterium]
MLVNIIAALGMIVGTGVLIMALALIFNTGSNSPSRTAGGSLPIRGIRRGQGSGYGPKDGNAPSEKADPLPEPGNQPPANRIMPVTLFAVLITGTYGKTPKLGQMIGERLEKDSVGAWEVAALKEKAAVIIPVFVQPFFGKDERIEFAYDGEVAGGEVFFRNTKSYKFALYPNEADIFVNAAKKIAEDILREHAIFAAKQTQSS